MKNQCLLEQLFEHHKRLLAFSGANPSCMKHYDCDMYLLPLRHDDGMNSLLVI